MPSMNEGKDNKQALKVDMGAQGTKTVKMDFPSNAHAKKEVVASDDGKRTTKVIQGNVTKRKKSFGRKIAETFIKEDVDSVSSYIIHDVLLPALRDTFSEMVKSSVDMMLFGEKRGHNTSRDRGKSYVSYNGYSNGRSSQRESSREPSSRSRATHNFDSIYWKHRGEAEEVLSQLVDLTVDYGEATVGDLYDLAGISGNFTDRDYGWTNLSSARAERSRDGWILILPKPIALNY